MVRSLFKLLVSLSHPGPPSHKLRILSSQSRWIVKVAQISHFMVRSLLRLLILIPTPNPILTFFFFLFFFSLWISFIAKKARWKGEEDKADKGRVGKTTSGNGQAWSSASPKGQWRTGKKWRKLVAKLFVVPQRPSRLRDWWWWWSAKSLIKSLINAWFSTALSSDTIMYVSNP